MLTMLAEQNDLDRADTELQDVLVNLAVFRAPVRNMRAGLHEIRDARNIISEWGQRARAAGPASG